MSNARTLALPGLVASLFMLVLVPGLWSSGPAAAQTTDPPAEFYGTNIADGIVVAAIIDGTECDSSTVTGGLWHITLQPDSCGGLAVNGARVTFTVDGVQADQFVTWRAGYGPPDIARGIDLTVGGGAGTVSADPADPDGPPEPPRLSRSQGLAIFSGGSLDDLEAAALAACPGGANVWANAPGGEDYLLFVAGAPFQIVNAAFTRVYGDGFDGPEPVIVTGCKTGTGS